MPRMSDSEIDTLLSRAGLVRIATIDAEGAPLVVPVGYVYRDREILMTARQKVTWLADIRRDPRVCLTIDTDRYPLSKVTIRGRAEVRYEPGQDDEWRDVRLPLADEATRAAADTLGNDEPWPFEAAYHAMTHDEPRALVVVPLEGSQVTSWRMPLVGEYLEESWAPSYYEREPRRFRVTQVGRTLADVQVVPE